MSATSNKDSLRIIQISPTTYAIQEMKWKGWLWWRKQAWGWHRPHYGYTGYESPRTFSSIGSAETWLEEQREMRHYPKVVKQPA